MSIDRGGRTGRRPGPTSSREALLEAARDQFTQHGYKGATVRAIAAQAGVDPGLIRHFFGDKDGLFGEAMELPPGAMTAVLRSFDAPREEWGERLARALLTLWDAPPTAGPLRAAVVAALGHDEARQRLRNLMIATVLDEVGPRLPDDRPELRIAVAVTHVIGLVLGRYVVEAPPLVEADLDELVAIVGPTVQRYLTGPLPAGGPAGDRPGE